MNHDAELRALLNHSDGESLQPIPVASQDGIAQAFSAAPLADPLKRLTAWEQVSHRLPGVYRHESCVAFYPGAGVTILRGRGVQGGPDGLIGFESGERVILRAATEDGQQAVIEALDGEIRAWEVVPGGDEIAEIMLPPDPIPLPDLAQWCAQTGAEPWLAAAVTAKAASPSAIDRLAAVGLLMRLWVAPEDGSAETPRGLWQAWAGAWLPDTVARAESDAVRHAWLLLERIREVGDLPDALAEAAVATIVLDRDDLASARRVLRVAGAGAKLAEALKAVDRAAVMNMSALTGHLPDLDDDPDADRWYAVAWQEPGAWWSGT